MKVGLAVYRDDPSSGGSFRVAMNLCRALPSHGVDVILFVAYGEAGPLAEICSNVHLLKAQGPADAGAWIRLRKGIRESEIALLHLVEPVIWINAVSGRSVPRMGHIHGLPPSLLPGGGGTAMTSRILDRVKAYLSAGCITISEKSKEAILALGWHSPDRVWLVRNGVDTHALSGPGDRRSALEGLGLDPNRRYLGMVCRLVPHRGCVDAVRMLASMDISWDLLLVGDGPAREEIQRAAVGLGLEDRVHLTGWTPNVVRAYSAIDIYLFLATYDSFGMSVAEAMAMRVPVIGLRGHGEYGEGPVPLLDDDTAELLDRTWPDDYDRPEDPRKLAALASMVDQIAPDKIERAHERVRSYFNADRQAFETAEAYKELLQKL